MSSVSLPEVVQIAVTAGRLRPTFLVVDDNPGILDGLAGLLKARFPKGKVLVAPTGEQALLVLRSESIDVIVSDHKMGAMDGISLLSHAANQSPSTIRIMITGVGDVAVAARAVNEGHVQALLPKPFQTKELVAIIERFLAKQTSAEQHQQAFARSLNIMHRAPWPFRDDITPAAPTLPDVQKSHILVVDDVPEISAFFKTLGTRLGSESVRITTVTDPREAIRIIKAEQVDVVISDYHMPHLTGIEVLVAAAKAYPRGRRILMTAYARVPGLSRNTDGKHVDAYMYKPFRAPETLAILHAAVLNEPRAMDHYRAQARAYEAAGDLGE